MVPCNCPECQKSEVPNFFEYNVLKQYKQEKVKLIDCTVGNIKKVNVLSLISDVFIEEDDGMKDERGEKIHVEVNPNIYVEGAKAEAKAQADAQADVDVKITNEIKININGLSGTFENLKEDLVDEAGDEKTKKTIEKEVSKVEKALDNIQQAKTKEDITPGTLSRIEKFIKKLNDTTTTVGKVFKGVEDGVGLAQDLAKNYNKIAQWLALPQVPDLFLGNQDK